MLARRLDHRIRREASALVKDARLVLLRNKDAKGKGGSLAEVTDTVDKALDKRDMVTVRANLPTLDALIDELVVRKPKAGFLSGLESVVITLALAFGLKGFVLEAFKIPSSSMYPTLEIGDHIFVNKFIYGPRIPWTTTRVFEVSKPQRGDVMVFIMPCEPDRDYIKRVVAVEGDSVEVRCSQLYVNGKAVPQQMINAAETYEDIDNEGKWHTSHVSRYRETVGDKSYDTFQSSLLPQGRVADGKDFPLPDAGPPSCVGNGEPAAPNQAIGQIVVTKQDAEQCEQQSHFIVPKGHIFAMGDNRSNSNDSRFWGPVPIENIKGKAMFTWLSYPETIARPDQYRWERIGAFVR
jgi:signal peptidase I